MLLIKAFWVVHLAIFADSCYNCVCGVQRASDGSQNHEEESEHGFGKVSELQDVVDRQTADLGQMKERMAAMVSRIGELEEDLDTARKDLIKSEDMNTRLQRDLREVGRSIHLFRG